MAQYQQSTDVPGLREHSFVIEQSMRNGLPPDARVPRNTPYAETMQNLKPTVYGAVTPETVNYPFSGSLSVDWTTAGIPALLRGERNTWLANKTALSLVTTSSNPWTSTAQTIYKSDTVGSELLTNPDFASGTGWTAGSGWSISGGNATATSASTTLAQSAILTVGKLYRVRVVVSGYTSGSLTMNAGATASGTYSGAGTFTAYIFCATSTGFSISGSSFTGVLSDASVKEVPEFTITAGGPWEIASFLDIDFLNNGASFIANTPGNVANTKQGTSNVTFKAIAGYRNRLLLGGCAGSWFTDTRFTKLVNRWKEVQTGDRLSYSSQAFDTSWVVFGERGGGANDRPFHPLLSACGVYGTEQFDNLSGIEASELENYQWGMCPLRYPGAIQAIHSLSVHPVVFGTNGISRLIPDGEQFMEEPIHPLGIPGRGCVGGNESECIFIDGSRDLWHLNGQSVTRLGYRSYMDDLDVSKVTISYDYEEGTYWITDTLTGYVLDGSGKLGGAIEVLPTNVFRDSVQGLVGVSRDRRSDTSKTTVLFRSMPLDITERGRKHISNYQISHENIDAVRAGADFRYEDASYQVGGYTQATKAGNCFLWPAVEFTDMKARITGTVPNSEVGVLQRVEVRYIADDITNRRGTKGMQETA